MQEKEVLSKEEEKDVQEIFDNAEEINREATLIFDKKTNGFLVKIPRAITDFFGLNEKNRFEKSMLLKVKDSPNKELETTFKIIDRTKKRKIPKEDKKKGKKNGKNTTHKK